MHLIQCSEIVWAISPTVVLQPRRTFQNHLFIHHLPKQAFAMPGDNCHIICAWLGIIVSLQADGTPMMLFGIEFGRHNAIILLA